MLFHANVFPSLKQCFFHSGNLRGGTRKVGKQERNRRKMKGRGEGKIHKVESGKSGAAIFFPKI